MKRFVLLTAIFVILSMSAAAQKKRTEPIGDTSAENSSSASASSRSLTPIVVSNAGLEAALVSSLDVRRSKVGDEVVLKSTKDLKQDGKVIIPKGSRIIGRVTEVQQKSENSSASKLGLIFERIEGKRFSSPITASIVSIASDKTAAALPDTAMGDIAGSSQTRTNASRGGSGGGLLGGVGSTVGGVVNGATQTVGSVAGTAVNTTGSAVGSAGETLRNIQITQSASGSASGAALLTANDKSLKLDKGVTFNLLVSSSGGN